MFHLLDRNGFAMRICAGHKILDVSPFFGVQFQPDLFRVMPQNESHVLADFGKSSIHGRSLIHAECLDTPYGKYRPVVGSLRSDLRSRSRAALEKPLCFATIRDSNHHEDHP